MSEHIDIIKKICSILKFEDYPELYSLVGSKVPDYRGLFLRGQGGNAAALGVQQDDAIRNITGEWKRSSDVGAYTSYMDGNLTGVFGKTMTTVRNLAGGQASRSDIASINFDVSRVVPTANENRPVNKAVRYLIRAKS